MPDPLFGDDLSASTLDDMVANAAYDNFFVETALQVHLRSIGAVDPFDGGLQIREPFIMGAPKAGAAAPGTTFNIEHVQQLGDTIFDIRLYTSRDLLEDFALKVKNRGPNAKVDLVDLYNRNAIKSISANVEVDAFHHGQPAIVGQIADNGTNRINGFSEALNDGMNNSWDGNVFVSYGQQARNGAVHKTLNSTPKFFGNADGSAAAINIRQLIDFIMQARKFTARSPEISITTPNGFAYILSALQTQQRFESMWNMSGKLPTVPDATGIEFFGTVIYDDIYCPGQAWGADFDTGYLNNSNVTGTFTSAATATGVGSISNLPASTPVTVGETIWAISGSSWKYRPTSEPDFLFGRREHEVPNNNTLRTYLINLALNVYTGAPRESRQGYGFNG